MYSTLLEFNVFDPIVVKCIAVWAIKLYLSVLQCIIPDVNALLTGVTSEH